MLNLLTFSSHSVLLRLTARLPWANTLLAAPAPALALCSLPTTPTKAGRNQAADNNKRKLIAEQKKKQQQLFQQFSLFIL